MRNHCFERAGLASLDDLDTEEWRSLFKEVEIWQAVFLDKRKEFRSKEYRWPSDTLHNCIRVWEYPFVYHHLRKYREGVAKEIDPTVVDLGSGVTFFPFAVANLGYKVIAVDNDPVCHVEYRRALAALGPRRGSVRFNCADAASIPIPAQSVDCVYCISVLEHIRNPLPVLGEAARILRPDGLFILTLDIDLNGKWCVGPALYNEIRGALLRKFDFVYPELTVHPIRLLTTDNSPYPYYPRKGALSKAYLFARRRASNIKALLEGRWVNRDRGPILASTYGACLRKRSPRNGVTT